MGSREIPDHPAHAGETIQAGWREVFCDSECIENFRLGRDDFLGSGVFVDRAENADEALDHRRFSVHSETASSILNRAREPDSRHATADEVGVRALDFRQRDEGRFMRDERRETFV